MDIGDTVLVRFNNGALIKGFLSEEGHNIHPAYVYVDRFVRVRASQIGRNKKTHLRKLSCFVKKVNVSSTRLVIIEKYKKEI